MPTAVEKLQRAPAARLSVFRVALTAGLAAAAFILICWIGARIGLGPLTHMYIQLFSSSPPASGLALLVGLCWSLVGGLIAGGLFAFIYNLLAPIDGR